MATVAELELKIRVLTERLEELERAKRGTNEFKEAVAGLRNQILALGTALIGLDKLKDFVDTGVEVNKTLESTRLGIAGIVTSQAELRDSQGQVLEGQDAFNAATGIASDQLKKLKVDSLSTISTFGELKDAFQAAISPGLGAGLDLDQIRNLTKEIAIASKAIGLQTNQIAQETRAILTGDIDMNAQLARNLGITSEMVARWKEQGTLAQELEKRLHGFVLAGDATAKSWAGVTSNMQEAYETLAGLATAGFYDAIKEKLNDALSGVFALNTGELEESLQGVSGLLTEILTDLGEVIGDAIVGMVDGIKQFSAYIQDNQGEIKDMEANFGLVFDQVKAIGAGLLEAVKAIVSAGTEGKVLSSTFDAIAQTLAAFRDGVDFIALAFTKLGAVVLEALAFPIEKAGKLLSAFGLEIGNIMQDVSRNMQDQAKAADESAGKLWQNFADGKTHVAALNAEAEKLHTLIDIPRSGGFDHLRDQILDFTAKLKDAKPPMEEIRAEAERLRSQVQVMFDVGQLSREEYIVALAKIDGATKAATESIKAQKKEVADLSESAKTLGIKYPESVEKVKKAFAELESNYKSQKVGLDAVREGFLKYAEDLLRSAQFTGKALDSSTRKMLEQKAAAYGVSEQLGQIAQRYQLSSQASEQLRRSVDYLANSYAEEARSLFASADAAKEAAEARLRIARATGDERGALEAAQDIKRAEVEQARAIVESLKLEIQQRLLKLQVLIREAQESARSNEAKKQEIAATLEEIKALEERQKTAELSAAATEAEAEATDKLASAKDREADASKKAEDAEREHAEQLKAAGDLVTGTLNGWLESLYQLSPAAVKAFEDMRGFTRSTMEVEDTATAAKDALDQLGQVPLGGTGFVRWMNEVAYAALKVKAEFYGQAQAAEDMAARIDQAMASNSGNLGALVREAESARGSFDLLDQARLDNLQQAIDAARGKMEQLRDASLSALDAAQRALLQEQGKQKELLELDLAQKKLELQRQINEARNAGDQEAIRNLQKALDLEEQTYQIKLKKLKASESNTTTTTAPSAPSVGNTTVNYNITADVSSLATEDFWRKKVLPISDKINRLRG